MKKPRYVPLHCRNCGRFISQKDANVVEDTYLGGYDADPYCPAGKGCRMPEVTWEFFHNKIKKVIEDDQRRPT